MEEIELLIAENRKLEAIKRYRELYNCTLKEAKSAVEALYLTGFAEAAPVDTVTQTDDADTDIITLLQERHKIEAIKLYKDTTGASLKEAKEYIDSLANEQNRYTSNYPTPEIKQKTGGKWVFVLFVAALLAALWFLPQYL